MRLLDLNYDSRSCFGAHALLPGKNLSHRNTGKILTNSEILYIKQSLTRDTLRNQ